MPTYTAHFFTEADWAKTTIKAASPRQALQRARQIESDETETLDFQSYDGTSGIERIEIWAADHRTVAEWQVTSCGYVLPRAIFSRPSTSRRQPRRL